MPVMALLALFLAIGKRRQELILLADNAANVRPIFRDYNLPLLDDMLRIVTTSTLIAYMLYTIFEAPSSDCCTEQTWLSLRFLLLYMLSISLLVSHSC